MSSKPSSTRRATDSEKSAATRATRGRSAIAATAASIAEREARAAAAAALRGLHMSGASDGDDDEPMLSTPPRASAQL